MESLIHAMGYGDKIGMDKLREFTECPVCTLATIRQSTIKGTTNGLEPMAWELFRYEEASKNFMQDLYYKECENEFDCY